MKKRRILLYSVPLLISIVLATWMYLTKNNFGGSFILVIGTGMVAWIILFDVFESKKFCETEPQA